jgi:hypothetical protein
MSQPGVLHIVIDERGKIAMPGGAARMALPTNRPTTIGRGLDCDIVIPNPGISRRNCIIERKETRWVLTDNNGTNRVCLNGRLIEGTADISHGDVIGWRIASAPELRCVLVDASPLAIVSRVEDWLILGPPGAGTEPERLPAVQRAFAVDGSLRHGLVVTVKPGSPAEAWMTSLAHAASVEPLVPPSTTIRDGELVRHVFAIDPGVSLVDVDHASRSGDLPPAIGSRLVRDAARLLTAASYEAGRLEVRITWSGRVVLVPAPGLMRLVMTVGDDLCGLAERLVPGEAAMLAAIDDLRRRVAIPDELDNTRHAHHVSVAAVDRAAQAHLPTVADDQALADFVRQLHPDLWRAERALTDELATVDGPTADWLVDRSEQNLAGA